MVNELVMEEWGAGTRERERDTTKPDRDGSLETHISKMVGISHDAFTKGCFFIFFLFLQSTGNGSCGKPVSEEVC